ncbi:MAG: hypothetical protein CM1200mP39_20870 [Dehalococcoidia bacterium]|nr:MAG: hypothetical protein CM1200mP39_20870 [Dehalococcoidia bacterium]
MDCSGSVKKLYTALTLEKSIKAAKISVCPNDNECTLVGGFSNVTSPSEVSISLGHPKLVASTIPGTSFKRLDRNLPLLGQDALYVYLQAQRLMLPEATTVAVLVGRTVAGKDDSDVGVG